MDQVKGSGRSHKHQQDCGGNFLLLPLSSCSVEHMASNFGESKVFWRLVFLMDPILHEFGLQQRFNHSIFNLILLPQEGNPSTSKIDVDPSTLSQRNIGWLESHTSSPCLTMACSATIQTYGDAEPGGLMSNPQSSCHCSSSIVT